MKDRDYLSMYMILNFIFIIFVIQDFVDGANWAQPSGRIQQNTVISKYPAPATPHWDPRYGMATIVQPATNLSSFSYLYVLGGDSYTSEFSEFNLIPGQSDLSFENGYKNDVWRTTGTTWFVQGDMRIRNKFHRKVPRVYSKLSWVEVSSGAHPPRGMDYMEWIGCQPYFANVKNKVNCTGRSNEQVMWSPRRSHAGVYLNGYLYVMGGRAREFITLPYEQSIGGILGPRVQDIPLTADNEKQQFSTQREISYLKNDIWRSADGKIWELVTPGCRVDQYAQNTKRYACKTTDDCYGAEECKLDTCVCSMWGPREQHAVAVSDDGFMYVSGGFGAQLYEKFSNCGEYACGDIDATTYRVYLSDIWRSQDGLKWFQVTSNAFQKNNVTYPRGGHQMLAFKDYLGNPYLWVFGGKGGPNQPTGGPIVYYNDIWRSPLSGNNPTNWELVAIPDRWGVMQTEQPWTSRTGHGVAIEQATADNNDIRTVYIYGGEHNGTRLNDFWSWRLDNPDEFWRQDFTPDAYFTTGSGKNFRFYNNSPARFYVTPDSNLSSLRRFWVPTDPLSTTVTPYQLRPYLSSYALAAMNSIGLYTISDLANADVYAILKLRGFDYPQVPPDQRLKVYDICDIRELAIAVVQKCSVNIPILYNGEQQMPWNVIPEFGGALPKNTTIRQKWHGRRNYNFLEPPTTDPEILTANWDGCTYHSEIQGLFGPNIPGLGYVDQVKKIKKPDLELENLFCQQTPGARSQFGMVMFEERLYVLGGQQNESYFYADTWYRDDRLPQVKMINPPKTHTSEPYFRLASDKPGSFFEYRVWDPYNYKEIRGWSAMSKKVSVSWMNWRKGGPGTGRYQIYFRAVDPAGNRDLGFKMGTNVYNWYYVSPTPWDIIFSVIGAFIGLCIAAYFEYRRRVKKAAMERYAMKRMRRKFKAMQRDIDGKAVDWRTLYMESKQAEEAGAKDKKKKLKKTTDKLAEKREKEKKKREKEKELIKKKLKAAKDVNKGKKQSKGLEDTIEAPVVVKKTDAKNLKTGKVMAGNDNIEDNFMFGDEEKGYPKSKGGAKALEGGGIMVSTKGGASAKVLTAEAGPGELLAAKNTESGFKQRKVNKRMKAYEETEEKDPGAGGGGGGGGETGKKDS